MCIRDRPALDEIRAKREHEQARLPEAEAAAKETAALEAQLSEYDELELRKRTMAEAERLAELRRMEQKRDVQQLKTLTEEIAVSYTHLDVYKRQVLTGEKDETDAWR